ncbi:MAG: putative ATP-dependent helicase, partial [Acidimicrobiaceae bacterium]|nr:putative ATP-dependent helicase [Acidimicrobiaceae bacterium]
MPRGGAGTLRRVTAVEALQAVVARLPGGGEPREGQVKMAEAVERAFAEERHLVVRAGTGTGKSLGYLVPAVLAGKRVVVATATKALQDQLAEKDLPLVAASMDRPFRFAVLKGRSNYLCRQRLREAEASGAQGELGEDEGRASSRRSEEIRRLTEWAEKTETGDRAELPDEPEPRVWSAFSVTAEECPGAFQCPSGGECFAEAARARAALADVVVVNLHLLGADVASGGVVLPEHDALVVDEAHALEDVMSDSLGISISAGRLRALAALARSALGARRGRGAGERAVDDLVASASQLEEALETRADKRLGSDLDEGLAQVVELLASRVERLDGALQRAQEEARAAGPTGAETLQRLSRVALVASGLRSDLAALVGLGEDQVAWVEGGGRPAIAVAPIDVGPVLAAEIFSKRPVVLASATIPPGLASRLGAESER